MSLKNRRILYICFFIVFFLLSPIVILLAEGYRFNSYRHRLEKTGVLFLEVKPEKSEVYLNGKLIKKKTDTPIKYLLPDDYVVEIKKDGYQTWQKKITINSGKTTFARNIQLFKEQTAPLILNDEIILTSQTVDNTLSMVYKNKDNQKYTLAFLGLKNGEITALRDLNFPPTKLTLSPGRTEIILEKENANDRRIWFFNLNNKKVVEITTFSSLEKNDNRDFKQLKWAEGQEKEIYGITENSLKIIDLAKEKITTLLSAEIIDFQIVAGQIFTLERSVKQNKVLIKKAELDKLELRETLAELPLSESYEFVAGPTEYLTVLNKNRRLLYLTPSAPNEEKIEIKEFSDINFASWQNGLLLMGNNFEILVYNPQNQERNTLTRLSTLIEKAIWYADANYVIYLNQDKISVTEVNDYQKNIFTLADGKNISDFFVNNSGEKIYFIEGKELKMVEIQ